jgi:hypothetical protein
LDANSFYLLFIPALAILAFLVGSILATMAMSNRVDMPPDDDGSEGQPAH